MDELLKQILSEIKEIKQGQDKLEQGQAKLEQGQHSLEKGLFNLSEKVYAFESQVNNRFDKLEKKIDTVYNAVADLIEFRTETEQKLKMIK